MNDWLTRLRQQPKSTRNQIALVTAGVTTFCITAVWLLSAPFSGTFETTDLTEQRGAWAQFRARTSDQVASVWLSLTGSSTASTTTAIAATSTPKTPEVAAVVIPTLSSSTITTLTTPPPKTILIATTSRATSSSTP